MTGHSDTPSEGERQSIIDPKRLAFLDTTDGVVTAAVIAVGTDGSESAWIYREGTPSEGNYAVPAHEQVGPLPPHIRLLIHSAVPRCGRPTKSGRPCRNRVNHPLNCCPLHAAQKDAPAARQRDRSE